MKLRLRDDSIRLRLTSREVDELSSKGTVDASTRFGGADDHHLLYGIEATTDGVVYATFLNRRITIYIPAQVIGDWSGTDRVGIEEKQSLGAGRYLQILVEKDFSCLKPRDGDDDTDTYPHPDAC